MARVNLSRLKHARVRDLLSKLMMLPEPNLEVLNQHTAKLTWNPKALGCRPLSFGPCSQRSMNASILEGKPLITKLPCLALLVLLCLFPDARAFGAVSETVTVIGRWCDRMLPGSPRFNGVMSIAIGSDGLPHLRIEYSDGSLDRPLLEVAGGVYFVHNSQAGDHYRIVSNTGNLQLLDSDGLIREAARLENTPQPGECRH